MDASSTADRRVLQPDRENAEPPLPETDNEDGAPDRLLAVNRWWRSKPWPAPFDAITHVVRQGDSRSLKELADESVHLVVTSPPYFNLKPYESDVGGAQLGRLDDYESFLSELDKVWRECVRVLVPADGLLRDRRHPHSPAY